MVINIQDLLHVRWEEAPNTIPGVDVTGAGTFTAKLNAVLTNEIAGASLASNQITLPAGTYLVEGSVGAFRPDQHQCHLYNVTDAGIEVQGTCADATGGANTTQTNSYVRGRFTIAAEKVFELRQYYDRGSGGTQGFGIKTNNGLTEVYADIQIYKIVDDLDTLHVQNRFTSGNGGSVTGNVYNISTLQTIRTNEISGASLTSNQITLPAGTYMIKAWCQSFEASRTVIAWYNVTDDTYDIIGECSNSKNGIMTATVTLFGRFTISTEKDFELRMYTALTEATIGFGRASGGPGDDVFADVYIQLQPS